MQFYYLLLLFSARAALVAHIHSTHTHACINEKPQFSLAQGKAVPRWLPQIFCRGCWIGHSQNATRRSARQLSIATLRFKTENYKSKSKLRSNDSVDSPLLPHENVSLLSLQLVVIILLGVHALAYKLQFKILCSAYSFLVHIIIHRMLCLWTNRCCSERHFVHIKPPPPPLVSSVNCATAFTIE